VTGGERILLDFARDLVLDYTLFWNPFPSASDLTGDIHQGWELSQEHHGFGMEPSGASLNNVRMEKTIDVHRGMLNVI